jgi:hypothetical protein
MVKVNASAITIAGPRHQGVRPPGPPPEATNRKIQNSKKGPWRPIRPRPRSWPSSLRPPCPKGYLRHRRETLIGGACLSSLTSSSARARTSPPPSDPPTPPVTLTPSPSHPAYKYPLPSLSAPELHLYLMTTPPYFSMQARRHRKLWPSNCSPLST